MAIEKITEGMTGQQVAELLYANDLSNSEGKIIYQPSANLHNPDTTATGTITSAGVVSPSGTYSLTDFIAVSGSTSYKSNVDLRRVVFFDASQNPVGIIDETVSTFTTPANAAYVRFMFTTAGNAYPSVKFGKSSDDINVDYAITPKTTTGETIVTETPEYLAKQIELENKVIYQPSANLHNPDTDIIHANISATGVVGSSTDYNVTDFIAVSGSTSYRMAGPGGSSISQGNYMRRVVQYDAGLGVIGALESVTTFTTPANAAYVRFMYHNTTINPANPATIKFGKSSDNINVDYSEIPYDKNGNRILTETGITPDDGTTEVLNVANSDKIVLVGSSSTESHYTLPNKSWINKLNVHLDWPLIGYGFSGNSADQIRAKLTADQPAPTAAGVSPSKINPTYVYVGQFGNMSDSGLNATFSDDFIAANRALMRTAKAVFGGEIIVGTGYTSYSKLFLESALASLAAEEKAYFMPLGYSNDNIIRVTNGFRAYKGFYGAAHPGTRSNAFYVQSMLNHLQNFKKPKKALKFYRPRPGVTDYTYVDIAEKLKKFYSIQTGEQSLRDDRLDFYDRLEPTSGYTPFALRQSEYLALLNNQIAPIGGVILVEGILDKIKCETVNFKVEVSGDFSGLEIYNPITAAYENLSYTSSGNIITAVINFVEFDKVRLLLKGTGDFKNPTFLYKGGQDKQTRDSEVNIAPIEYIEDGGGQTWDDWTNIGTTSTYIQSGDFVDLPNYLSATSSILKITSDANRNGKSKLLSTSTPLGGRKRLMLEVFARVNPKIYDPDQFASWTGPDNPFTDVIEITPTSYDLATLRVEFGATQINVKKVPVDLFWQKIQIPLELPGFQTGNLRIGLLREPNDLNASWPLEIADIKIYTY